MGLSDVFDILVIFLVVMLVFFKVGGLITISWLLVFIPLLLFLRGLVAILLMLLFILLIVVVAIPFILIGILVIVIIELID